jgi:hypothetical protein
MFCPGPGVDEEDIVATNACVAALPQVSAARTVKLNVPVWDGVPATVAEKPLGLNERPPGSDPDTIDQFTTAPMNGFVTQAPVAFNVWL